MRRHRQLRPKEHRHRLDARHRRPQGSFQIIDTVGLATALNIVNQYQSVPGLLSPLLKKMMMPYNFKTMSKLLQDMLDKGEKFYE